MKMSRLIFIQENCNDSFLFVIQFNEHTLQQILDCYSLPVNFSIQNQITNKGHTIMDAFMMYNMSVFITNDLLIFISIIYTIKSSLFCGEFVE